MKGKYDLRVLERQLNKWIHADISDINIALNFEVNDIAELKSMKNNWSQAFKLPVTPTNARLFELAELPNAGTNLPYRQIPARLFYNGIRIAGKGTMLIFHKTTPRYYECQLISGNKDFFNRLKEIMFSDLDFGTYRVINESLIPDNWTDDKTKWPDVQSCFMGIASFIARNAYPAGRDNVFLNTTGGNYPFVKIPYIIREIEAKSGYEIDDSRVAHLYENDALSLADVNVVNNEYAELNSQISVNTPGGAYAVWNEPLPAGILGTFNFHQSSAPYWVDYTAAYNQTFKITFAITVNPQDNNGIRGEIIFKGDTKVYLLNADNNYTQTVTMNMVAGDTLVLYVHILNLNNTNMHARVVFSDFETQPLSNIGASLKISERIGFNTCFDFFKFLAEAYGLILMAHETYDRIIVFNPATLYLNKNSARLQKSDNVLYWSDKLQKDSQETSYTLGSYAQNNYLKMENNEADGITGERAAITVNNVNLSLEKDMYFLPVQAGKDFKTYFISVNRPVLGNEVISFTNAASIPFIKLSASITETNESETETTDISGLLENASLVKIKPHLVKKTNDYSWIKINSENFRHFPVVRSITVQDLVTNNYADLQKMMEKIKIIEADFNLSPFDIQFFNPIKPVHIQDLGGFFYLQKIANYQPGRLTKVTLIKL